MLRQMLHLLHHENCKHGVNEVAIVAFGRISNNNTPTHYITGLPNSGLAVRCTTISIANTTTIKRMFFTPPSSVLDVLDSDNMQAVLLC